MEELAYRFGRATEQGKRLIVGKVETPNPIEKVNILPLDKMRVGDALFFHKLEMVGWKWKLAKSTVIRYNRQLNIKMFAFVESDKILEIVRIK